MLNTFRISGNNFLHFYLQVEGGNRILNKNIEFLGHFVKHIPIIHGESERSWACSGLPSGLEKELRGMKFFPDALWTFRIVWPMNLFVKPS